jgi:hypothetical protein
VKRNCNLIRSEGIEQHAFDNRVDSQGADFLAQDAGVLIAINPAAIDGVVSLRRRLIRCPQRPQIAMPCSNA